MTDPSRSTPPPHDPSAPRRAVAPPWLAPLLLVLCAAAATASVLQLRAPDAAGAAGGFSVDRALATVESLAAQRRAVGTEGHAAALRELQGDLTALGLEVEVQRTTRTELETDEGPQRIVYVQNLLGRLRGSGEREGAILLTAHYDSVEDGPGAADDASAVAALLEVMRLLAAGEPPQRDVIALFSDGEELGLMGADAFAARHPWADDLTAVLNFEARGVRGPSIMFETGRGGGRLVDLYAEVAPSPVANSLSEAVYRLLPNDTDFSVYKRRGLPGLNFAFIHGVSAYHHRNDSVDNLSAASMAHHGTTALALVHALAAAPAETFADGERSFFNLPGLGLVTYSRSWGLPLAALALLTALAGLLLAWRRYRPAGGAVLRGAFAGMATIALTLIAALVLDRVVSATYGLGPSMLNDHYSWHVGWGLLAAGVAWLLLRLFLGRSEGPARPVAAAAAGLAPWALLVLPTTLYLPSLSHLLTWPLLAAAVALLLLARSPADSGRVGLAASLALLVSALVLFLLWTPPVALLPVAMGSRAVSLLAVIVALAVTLLAPALELLPRPAGRGWALPALLAVVGLVVALIAGSTAGFTGQRLQPTSVYHLQDADAGEAWAMTLDMPPEPWTAQFVPADAGERPFPRFFEGAGAELAAAASPTLPLPPPKLELTATEELEGGGRRLHLRLTSQRGAARIAVLVRSPEPLAKMTLGGVGIDLSQDLRQGSAVSGDEPRARVRLDGSPAEGWEMVVEQATAADLSFDLVDWRWDLPAGLGGGEPPAGLQTRLRSGVFHRIDFADLTAPAPELLTGTGSQP